MISNFCFWGWIHNLFFFWRIFAMWQPKKPKKRKKEKEKKVLDMIDKRAFFREKNRPQKSP